MVLNAFTVAEKSTYAITQKIQEDLIMLNQEIEAESMSGQTLSRVAEGVTPLKEDDPLAGLNPEGVPDAVAALRGLLEGYERLLAQSVLDVNPGMNRYSIAARAALAKLEATR